MFLFPISTDAPIYYRPIGTVLLILANIVCFILTDGGMEESLLARDFALEFGSGMNPVEWISCHFLHYGFIHLLGNMFFLFIYGLIIEGKIGTIPFSILYFVICWLSAAIAQMLMMHSDSFIQEAGGASMVIFGLMLISLMWAPKNEIGFFGFYIIFFVPRIVMFEVTVMWVGVWYVLFNLFIAWLEDFQFGSAMAHLLGGGIGLGLAIVLLKLNWVDCEKWDLLSLMRKDPTKKSLHWYRANRPSEQREFAAPASADDPDLELPDMDELEKKRRRLAARYRLAISEEKPKSALKYRRKISLLSCEELVSREDDEGLIQLLMKQENWTDAISQLEAFIARHPEHSNSHQLKLAELWLVRENRPFEALNILSVINVRQLDPRRQKIHQKLIERARERTET